MKLGFLTEASANGYYRAVIPMRALEQRGHDVMWQRPLGNDLPISELLRCDLVHCYRRMEQLPTLRTLADHGVAISFDNDDDFAAAEMTDTGQSMKLDGHLRNKKRFREVLRCAKLADVTTTTSTVLAEQYRLAGAEEVLVVENHLERGMFGFGSKAKHDGVVVGWVAGREHRLDLDRLPIVDTFRALLDAHENLRVLTVGVRLPLRSNRYEHVSEVAYRDILTVIGQMDIGIAPLADTQFNRSRSNVKLKEYGSAGVPWLASPVGPYAGLGERQGGRLVSDADWSAALDDLIRNARVRRRLEKRALKWAASETIDRHVHGWERAIAVALERSTERQPRAAR